MNNHRKSLVSRVTRPAAPRLSEGLDTHRNALNFLRLVLASLVIVGHTYPLGGFGSGKLAVSGELAVDGFFAISGFLIAGSRMKIDMLPYLWRRTVRIFPGYWVSLLVVGFAFAPLSCLATGSDFDPSSALGFAVNNATLFINQAGVANTLSAVPYPGAWNGSLWTLGWEFLAYLACGATLSIAKIRRRPKTILGTVAVIFGILSALVWGMHILDSFFNPEGVRLGYFFLAGMLMYFVAPHVPRTALFACTAVALIVVASLAGGYSGFLTFAPVPVAFLLLYFGCTLPVRIGVRNDISYGMYIYAFPVQQLLSSLGGHRLGFAGFAVMSIVFTTPLAWASWLLVEKPMMRLRRFNSRRKDIPPAKLELVTPTSKADTDDQRAPG